MLRCVFILCAFCLTVSCEDKSRDVPAADVKVRAVSRSLEATDGYSSANAMSHAQALVDLGPRIVGSEAAKKQREYLKKHLELAGWTVKEQAFSVHGVEMVNVCARKTGKASSAREAPTGILSCHVDTKQGIEDFVGANDGASGAAHLLELARLMPEEQAQQVEIVFFDGEESFAPHMTELDGLYGSKYYAKNLPEPLPVWAVNFDMVGRRGMKIRIPSDTSQGLYLEYLEALKVLGLPSSQWGVSAGPIMDDHVPLANRGIATLNIIDDFLDGHWWHTSADNMELLHLSSFDVMGRFSLQLLQQLLPK